MSIEDPTQGARPARVLKTNDTTGAASVEPASPTTRGSTPTGDASAASPVVTVTPAPAGNDVLDTNGADGAGATTALEADDGSSDGGGSFLFLTAVPSWLTSMVIHVIVLLSLAMLSYPKIADSVRNNELVLGNSEDEVDQLDDFLPEEFEPVEFESVPTTDQLSSPEVETTIEQPEIGFADDPTAAAMQFDIDPLGLESAPRSALLQTTGALTGSALEGRGQKSRSRMVREGGGTQGSEEAVAQALRWLAEHQLPDGGWNLDHRLGRCQGRCGHPGSRAPARFGATALALLPFLGAGHTHQEGEYKDVVGRGLQFLMSNSTVIGNRGRLVDEGNYYSHGLCAIAFCEAFAMSRDKGLMKPAQMLINETVFAQDPFGGGWRYKPQEPGDTSAVGWQVMALKSANMAYLQVPAVTIQKASLFLDSVQQDGGARYGYQDPGNRGSTSSVGLLCRMYMGWKRDNPALKRGVAFISKAGPSKVDIYYNYYATQVMRHFGGYEWERWNEVMREFLIQTQDTAGHEQGSWYFNTGHHHIEAGGRLYCTSLATMILEVYYRHMPLYQEEVTDDEFPL